MQGIEVRRAPQPLLEVVEDQPEGRLIAATSGLASRADVEFVAFVALTTRGSETWIEGWLGDPERQLPAADRRVGG